MKKISKKQLKRIIAEEVAAVMAEMDTASNEQVAAAAEKLGGLLVGQPGTAAAVRDALSKRYPEAAKALYQKFSDAQAHLDMVYSSYDE